MLPLNHFFLGYSLTWLVLLLITQRFKIALTGKRLVIAFSIAICGGFWAFIPDAHYILPLIPSLHSPYGNIFFLHNFIDSLPYENEVWFNIELYALFATMNFFVTLFGMDPMRCAIEVAEQEVDEFVYLS